MKILCVLLLSGCAISNLTGDFGHQDDAPETLVLRVTVHDVEYTGIRPKSDCPAGYTCIPFYSWFKYRASVTKVIKGPLKGWVISFANFQHTFYAKRWDEEECYVVLKRANSEFEETVGVQYTAEKILFQGRADHQAEIQKLLAGG